MKKNLKKEKELLEKIREALAENDACALLVGGKHRYAVMKWETYQAWKSEREKKSAEFSKKDNERKKEWLLLEDTHTEQFDINDIPV